MITTCTKCGSLYEAGSEEQANEQECRSLGKHHSARGAVRACMLLHADGDYWKNYLAEPEYSAHTRNAMRPNDYLDDMHWAENRRARGFSPEQRARLDMPTDALFGVFP